MIRPVQPDDSSTLIALAEQTGVFKPAEIVALEEVLRDYHAAHREQGHRAVARVDGPSIAGFAYYAPSAMSDRGWYLWWIAVRKDVQARGIGGLLLRHAEEDMLAAGGRMVWIETSSLPHYEPTRRFYLKHGYEQAATLADFYADGDHMIVFRKRLAV